MTRAPASVPDDALLPEAWPGPGADPLAPARPGRPDLRLVASSPAAHAGSAPGDGFDDPRSVTFLFTDIEGSTRLWEQRTGPMKQALARHDELARAVVEAHGGLLIKTTGDGLHAAFPVPLAGVLAARDLALALADADQAGLAMPLAVRFGLHLGYDERRGGDFYGRDVNRAARIMSCAHGGQIVLSSAVAERVRGALPGGADLLDLGVVRLRDLSAPERLHQLVQPGLRERFPALRSLASTPNNLAQQVNSFVGREEEMAHAKALLGEGRLVSLVGLGGIGKTRLAMQLAAEVLDDYPDGVWFVEFAPLADPQLVPQAVATVLGVKEEAGQDITEALARFVKDRRLLITFDNCEHVVQACADLAARLLRAGAELKLLATTREALQIAGETLYALPTLAVPDHRRVPTVAEIARQESVRLFADRVRAAQPQFTIGADNALAVSEICRQLDGIPLALELAAARARQMSVATIAQRIGDRFRLLTNGDRAALPRQQTLRALIDWSHDLLTEPERILFRRLSVFAGGWTLEAAEAVCADESLPKEDVFDLLGRLVEKSLISIDLESGRYRMLETVREYGQEKRMAIEPSAIHECMHVEHFLRMAERAALDMVGPQQATALRMVDGDRENYLAAHAYCGRVPDGPDHGAKLVHALRLYLLNRGLLGLGTRLANEALGRTAKCMGSTSRCIALHTAGNIAYFAGQYEFAKRHFIECLANARARSDDQMVGATLHRLAMASWASDDPALAERSFVESISFIKANGGSRELACALIAYAQYLRTSGNSRKALPIYIDANHIVKEHGDHYGTAVSMLNASMAAIEIGEVDAGVQYLSEALPAVEAANSLALLQCLLDVAAGLAFEKVRRVDNARLFQIAEEIGQETGCVRDPADRAFLEARLFPLARGAASDGRADREIQARSFDRVSIYIDLACWLESIDAGVCVP